MKRLDFIYKDSCTDYMCESEKMYIARLNNISKLINDLVRPNKCRCYYLVLIMKYNYQHKIIMKHIIYVLNVSMMQL